VPAVPFVIQETDTMAEDTPAAGGPYNILFILTDQERQFRPDELPKDYRLPAHERLAQKGVVFENHRINSCVCTSSRSVIYTGLHIQQTGMFDNANFPWSRSLPTDIKTLGHLMREAGYYTAYKGKWHLTREFETDNTLAAPTVCVHSPKLGNDMPCARGTQSYRPCMSGPTFDSAHVWRDPRGLYKARRIALTRNWHVAARRRRIRGHP